MINNEDDEKINKVKEFFGWYFSLYIILPVGILFIGGIALLFIVDFIINGTILNALELFTFKTEEMRLLLVIFIAYNIIIILISINMIKND